MSKQFLADNLRLLCSYKKSISGVCRELEINRQQFNKYLSGNTTPSGNNLRKICDYFGVEDHEIRMPQEEFARIVQSRPLVATGAGSRLRPEIELLEELFQSGNEDLSKYEGSYYIYYYSTSYPGRILKAYGVIYEQEGRHFFKWIEHLSLAGTSRSDGFIYKLKGMVLGLSNRIFVSGYEQIMKNELVHLILYPTYKNKVSRLSGLLLGVSGADSREPVSQRVVFSYLGKHISHRAALKRCGIYEADSDEMDPEIEAGIQNRVDPEIGVFRALPL